MKLVELSAPILTTGLFDDAVQTAAMALGTAKLTVQLELAPEKTT